MAGSTIGKNFKVSTFGESHGPALGLIIDGCPAGIRLSHMDIQKNLDRRKPGTSKFTTARKEEDKVEILSGVLDGITTGTPIGLLIKNKDQRSADYSKIANTYRPGHADYCYDQKYGIRDYRGGGRSSGRETVARVAAGSIAKIILRELNVSILTYTRSIGDAKINYKNFDKDYIDKNPFYMPDNKAAKKADHLVSMAKADRDSLGGVIECIVKGVPAGLGEPVFEKLDAMLAKAVMSIGGCKGFEIGSGFEAAKTTGSQHNDSWYYDNESVLHKTSNHAGGILGGISDGSDIILRGAFKPTPSIGKKQSTITRNKENVNISIKGRHDPIIVPRAVVVLESMVAITLVDYLYSRIFSDINMIKKAYAN